MFEFDKETIDTLKKLKNRKAILEMDFMDGETVKVIGILTGNDKLIKIIHDSNILPVFKGLMADFEIKLIKTTPMVVLANLTRYQNGVEVASDQVGIIDFRLIEPNELQF